MASNHPGPLDITYSAHELRQGKPHPTPAERQREAARAMLAALKALRWLHPSYCFCSLGDESKPGHSPNCNRARAAIALAESAGIKVEG